MLTCGCSMLVELSIRNLIYNISKILFRSIPFQNIAFETNIANINRNPNNT